MPVQADILLKSSRQKAQTGEKGYAKANGVKEIICGAISSADPDDIELVFIDYYKGLFKNRIKNTTDLSQRTCGLLARVSRLDQATRDSIEEPFSLQVEQTVNYLTTSKTPDSDEIPTEFYKRFNNLVCPLFLRSYCESYSFIRLPLTFLRTTTVFILKSEDPAKPQNVTRFSPITVCIVDYTILAKMLTARIQTFTKRHTGVLTDLWYSKDINFN